VNNIIDTSIAARNFQTLAYTFDNQKAYP